MINVMHHLKEERKKHAEIKSINDFSFISEIHQNTCGIQVLQTFWPLLCVGCLKKKTRF